jgi:hypothetical protein
MTPLVPTIRDAVVNWLHLVGVMVRLVIDSDQVEWSREDEEQTELVRNMESRPQCIYSAPRESTPHTFTHNLVYFSYYTSYRLFDKSINISNDTRCSIPLHLPCIAFKTMVKKKINTRCLTQFFSPKTMVIMDPS